eukprot:TRINITY_DN2289_c3_g1_i1.p1 TRINITY_DN2289_c3_g1~~TRINITY_DN2289_c3_g1_i1.p1  ORF type:complete len:433 (+),score=43.70 TRINITY_DN2289_c3_g1_i1:81-1301(+)
MPKGLRSRGGSSERSSPDRRGRHRRSGSRVDKNARAGSRSASGTLSPLRSRSRSRHRGSGGSTVTQILDLEPSKWCLVVGRRGATMKEVMAKHRVVIDVPHDKSAPGVTVKGAPDDVDRAVEALSSIPRIGRLGVLSDRRAANSAERRPSAAGRRRRSSSGPRRERRASGGARSASPRDAGGNGPLTLVTTGPSTFSSALATMSLRCLLGVAQAMGLDAEGCFDRAETVALVQRACDRGALRDLPLGPLLRVVELAGVEDKSLADRDEVLAALGEPARGKRPSVPRVLRRRDSTPSPRPAKRFRSRSPPRRRRRRRSSSSRRHGRGGGSGSYREHVLGFVDRYRLDRRAEEALLLTPPDRFNRLIDVWDHELDSGTRQWGPTFKASTLAMKLLRDLRQGHVPPRRP